MSAGAISDTARSNTGTVDTTNDTSGVERNGDRIVVLGRIGGAFGVNGWVKIQSYTDPPGNLLKYPVWLLRTTRSGVDDWVVARRVQGREVNGLVQAQLHGTVTREQAAELRDVEIGVRRNELPALPPGEFYWEDLVGLEACCPRGEPLGRIEEIRAMPAHPLLRLVERLPSGSKPRERLVPLVRERVKAVDLAKGRIVLDWQSDW